MGSRPTQSPVSMPAIERVQSPSNLHPVTRRSRRLHLMKGSLLDCFSGHLYGVAWHEFVHSHADRRWLSHHVRLIYNSPRFLGTLRTVPVPLQQSLVFVSIWAARGGPQRGGRGTNGSSFAVCFDLGQAITAVSRQRSLQRAASVARGSTSARLRPADGAEIAANETDRQLTPGRTERRTE